MSDLLGDMSELHPDTSELSYLQTPGGFGKEIDVFYMDKEEARYWRSAGLTVAKTG